MITSVNKSNADKYSYLYEQASEYLMTHDDAGMEVELGSLSAMMPAKKLQTQMAIMFISALIQALEKSQKNLRLLPHLKSISHTWLS